MAKYLISGVSSGIGQALTKILIEDGHYVFGIARRERLLKDLKATLATPKRFSFTKQDISKPNSWRKIVAKIRQAKFIPQIVVLNAAILDNDISKMKFINVEITQQIFETNFFSNLRALNELFKLVKPKTKIIFIGSSSAFKGSGEEGIGYSASKAALSNALESLQLKYKDTYDFKIIHFGPVATDMLPLKSKVHFVITPEHAARQIIKTINSRGHIHHCPGSLFIFIRLVKLLPSSIYFKVLSTIDALHRKNTKRTLC